MHSVIDVIDITSLRVIHLGLSECFTDENIVILMEQLCKDSSIKELRINPDVVHRVRTVSNIQYMPLQQQSELTGILQFCAIPACHLSYVSSLAIGKMLRENTTLNYFEIVYVTVDNEPHFLYPILEALNQNTSLKMLLLRKWQHSIPYSLPTLSADEDNTAACKADTISNLSDNQKLEILGFWLYPQHYPALLQGLTTNKILQELCLPREHMSYVINCPEFLENIHRIQFVDTAENRVS